MKIYIYIIWFPTSDKYYIGQTHNLRGRMFTHLNVDSLVGKALYKYDDWKISILHTCKTRDEANLIEIEEIRNFNSVAPNGYNLTRGGEGCEGYKHTKEAKEKIRQAGIGRQHTEKTKEEIRRSHKGKKNPKSAKARKGIKRPDVSKRLKGNKYFQGCHHTKEAIEKIRRAKQGKRDPKVQIKHLKTRLANLEKI